MLQLLFFVFNVRVIVFPVFVVEILDFGIGFNVRFGVRVHFGFGIGFPVFVVEILDFGIGFSIGFNVRFRVVNFGFGVRVQFRQFFGFEFRLVGRM